MLKSTSEIIEETNQIVIGIYNNVHKVGASMDPTIAAELIRTSIEAAAKIMQAQILAKVLDSKNEDL